MFNSSATRNHFFLLPSLSVSVFVLCFVFSSTPESERVNVSARIGVRTRTRCYEPHRNYVGRLFIKLITPYSFCTPPPGPRFPARLLVPLPHRRSSRRRRRRRGEEPRSAVFVLAARCSAAAAATVLHLAARTRPFSLTCAAPFVCVLVLVACRYCIYRHTA